jgi:transcriptional regulator with XRE-family HTH domain
MALVTKKGHIMPAKRTKQWRSTPLNRALQEYLAHQQMKQQLLADYLNVDVRTLRRWLSGDTVITDVRELRRVAELLGVEPEKLGVTPSLYMAPDPEEIDAAIDHVWKLVRTARYYEANALVDKLIRDIASLIHTEDVILLQKLARAQHIAGYVKSQVLRSNETAAAYSHYHEMERIARILDDQTLLNVALTYQGDMLQRGGQVAQGIEYLEAARNTTPQADAAARGNGIQLLGRAYFKARRLGDFERMMKEAEALAYEPEVNSLASSAQGQYSAGTVYEEWGRSLGLLGQMNAAMDYLDKAEGVFSPAWTAQRRDLLMKSARAMVLVHGGEIRQGIEVAVEAVNICRDTGNVRLLERIYGVQQYLDRLSREIGNAGSILREALAGPVEY